MTSTSTSVDLGHERADPAKTTQTNFSNLATFPLFPPTSPSPPPLHTSQPTMQSGRVSVSHATGVKNEDESYPAEGMGASNTHDADADADDLWPSPSMSATGPLPPWPPRSGPAAAPMPFASPLLERESTSTGTRPPLLLPPPPASAFDADAMGGFQLLGAWPASPRPPAAARRNDADSSSTHSLPFAAPAFSSACAPPPPPFFSKACIDNGDNGVSGRACTTSTFSLAGVGASSSSSVPRFSSPAIFMPPFAAAAAGMGADNAGSGRGMRLAGGRISAPPPSAATFAPSPLARSACAASQHTSEQMERAASTSAEDVHQEALRRASPDAPPTSPESAASSPVAADANPTPVLPKRSSSHSNGSGSAHGNAPNASDAPMSSSLACARSIDDRDGDSGDGDRAGGDEVRENVRASATAFLLADGTDGVAPDTPRRPRARSFDNGHGQPLPEGELIPDHEQERAMQSADSTASVTATLEELSEWRRLISDKLGDPFFLQALRSTRSGASLQVGRPARGMWGGYKPIFSSSPTPRPWFRIVSMFAAAQHTPWTQSRSSASRLCSRLVQPPITLTVTSDPVLDHNLFYVGCSSKEPHNTARRSRPHSDRQKQRSRQSRPLRATT